MGFEVSAFAFSSPAVSVAIPAYNAERTIAATLDSVLAQTVGDIEIIVCNDASTDRTGEILAAYRGRKVRVITNPENSGEGVTRDNAMREATAPWIAVIDADDAWEPNRLERLLSIAGDGVMAFDDLMVCHDVAGELKPWHCLRGASAYGASAGYAVDVPVPAYIRSGRLLIKPIIPANLINELSIRHSGRKFGADTEFFLRLLNAGLKLRYLPEPLYLYRVTPNSATGLATDHSLMRKCIEECAGMAGWDEDVVQAFSDKIRALRHDETLYALRDSVRQVDILGVLKLIGSDPGALKMLPSRLLPHLYYHIHRKLSGGSPR